MGNVIKNSKAYDSGDVEVTINGTPIDILEITYDTEQEHQLNHTLKNNARSWSQGKITHTASIRMMMHDAVVLEAAVGGDLLSARPFNINVTYINLYNVIINDTITAKFMKQGREVTGDMGLNKQYDLFVLDIKYNNLI
ncbi:hypothetical protein [Aquimarina algiphila]|uniref:Uncharacterized protein n=1 Tax=Aquimarina algiphila TaxID=2047982 RepID=A0A554VEX0_9FLAO|nr:hypothetical protein [Aquimarina algiphila]TSE05669.1 hypothetical protein FOF46_21820 [Aquimarina algiphila]